MSKAYTGGCACGAVRYEITAEPVFSNDCQCRDCQRESGTGHQSHLTFPREGVTLTGEGRPWDMVADSGGVKTRNFCPHCGLSVFLTFADMPDIVAIRAATLDDPSRFAPTFVTYADRAHEWDRVDPALTAFAKMPPGPQ